ncbi:hypothetical protein [Actinoplanes palleronii]|uniref:Uncharacterized protein n=1 Tax=Actinoplanes palleronii TaxID=113570 RepID=A0ABQ4B6P0_9ACTN|nr:hypothetical protein [Actinoplanes palleronii]GIE65935.1 hypothetical protein Apa02nite_020430 [Actinoplanes palleronii]
MRRPGFVRPGAAAPAPSTDVAGIAACPERKDLEGLFDLLKGWSLGSMECAEGLAAASRVSTATTVGDGWYLRQFIGKGWMYHGEGSGYDCKDLGIEGSAPFGVS